MDGSERTTETERRRATVLFADLTGFTTLSERLDPEEAYGIVTQCLQILDRVARHHGGSVDKYLGDAVMAVFGVPLAMEDAARAAVNAAIDMHRRVEAFVRERKLERLLGIHSGINTGLLISGDVSGPVLREFAVMGDAVNVAARLKDLAPRGQIWVGEETWRRTRQDFEYRTVAPLKLKGRSEPVGVYEVSSRDERLYRRGLDAAANLWLRFVGRDAELGAFRERLLALGQEGRGGVLSVVGEAGLGKSRLVLEAQALEEAEGLAWLEGRSLAVGGNLSFHPIRDLLRRWAGIEERDEDAAAQRKLTEALAPLALDGSESLPFLASLAGLRPTAERRELLRGIEGEALEKLMRKAVSDLLRAAAGRRPLVLVFEDLHWADLSSVELIQAMLPLTARYPILIVAVYRPGYAATSERIREEALRLTHHVRVSVEPLDLTAAESLLADLFEEGGVPAATRHQIERNAAGNPFYIEEVLRSMLEAGGIVMHDGRLRATGTIADVTIPDSVQEVLMARIDRLDLRTKNVLQVLSVAGGETPHEILAEIASDDGFEEDLQRLVELDFVGFQERGGRCTHPFKHPLVQEVCYESILKAKRQELHLRTAQAVEDMLPESTPGYHGMLAYHFGRAQDLVNAEKYLFQAGDAASRIAASSEALHFFQEASRLYRELHAEDPEPQKMALLEQKVALAHFNRGHLLDAIEHINRALECHGLPVPRSRVPLLLRSAVGLTLVLGRLYLPAAGRGRPAATEREREIADILFKRARSQTTTEPLRFLSDTIEAMRFDWSFDPRSLPGIAGSYAGSSGLFAFSGMFGVSRRFLTLAHEYLDEADVSETFVVRFFEFVHHFLAGTRTGIPEIDAGLVEKAVRKGLLWDVCTYLGLLVKKRVYEGDFEAAAQWIEYLAKVEDQYDYEGARENRQGGLAFLAAERGDYAAAIEASERYYADSREVLPNLLALSTRARAEALSGDLEAARETVARAERLVGSQARVPALHLSAHLRSRLLLAVVELERALERGDARSARRLGRAARRAARAAVGCVRGVAWRRPEVYRLAGRVAWLRGKRTAGLRWLERALEEADGLSLRPEAARAHAAVSRMLDAGGGEQQLGGLDAAAHRARARETLAQLGLEGEMKRLEQSEGSVAAA